jgi:hypothetical protein
LKESIHRTIKEAARSLRSKLKQLSVSSLGISPYNQRYLNEKIGMIDAIMDIYSRQLHLVLKDYTSDLKNFVLVDYGGGSGIFSLLAKEAGIGTVIYNDIYDLSCADVRKTSKALNITIDHIVCGDADALITYIQQQSITINAIASFDVIEHIYNIEEHFEKLSLLQNMPFILVYGSGANPENPWKVKAITKIQQTDEYENKAETWGYKERDTLQPFLDVRKHIISSYAQQIKPSDVEYLAKATRGLIKEDIKKCVDEFLSTGSISYKLEHPTNTCDPLTGNWSEHLMNLPWLEKYLQTLGFKTEILPGYYPLNGPWINRGIKSIINGWIKMRKRKGMGLAPYFWLVAKT